MQKTVIGNWKMHGDLASAASLASEVSNYVSASVVHSKVVVCPPTIHATVVAENIAGSNVSLGAQDSHFEEKGAHTGEISAYMLKDAGVEYVILGHSERRANLGESSQLVAQKANAAKNTGLVPVICIGETLQQRESGEYSTVLKQQIEESIPESFTAGDFLIAYEPVWAIGTGKVADVETIMLTHKLVADAAPEGTHILYGGSVKPDNAAEIMAINHVDGVLVGGASLTSESFNKIIQAAESVIEKVAA